ncbi:MAG TPA: hypothetical protein VGK85_10975, partial [Myxococcaceae bacterium]
RPACPVRSGSSPTWWTRVAEEAPGAEPHDGNERWGRLYAVVLAALALEIAGLWVLERVFR